MVVLMKLLAAALVVRRMYLIVAPRPFPAAPLVVRRASQELDRGAHADAQCATHVLDRGVQAVSRGAARCASQVLDHGAQVDARGATHLLDRGVQAVACGAASCALHVHGRGARTDACGHSFAVLSTQVSTDGLRLKRCRLACVSILM